MSRTNKALPYVARYEYSQFLNYTGFHEGAYIRAYVEDTSKKPMIADKYNIATPRVVLEIADCDRRVCFDFDWSDVGMLNNMKKIDTLIEGLQGFKRAMAQEHKLVAKRRVNAGLTKADADTIY